MIPVLENSQDFFRLCQIIVILDQRDIPEEERRKMMVSREKKFFKIVVAIGERMG